MRLIFLLDVIKIWEKKDNLENYFNRFFIEYHKVLKQNKKCLFLLYYQNQQNLNNIIYFTYLFFMHEALLLLM